MGTYSISGGGGMIITRARAFPIASFIANRVPTAALLK